LAVKEQMSQIWMLLSLVCEALVILSCTVILKMEEDTEYSYAYREKLKKCFPRCTTISGWKWTMVGHYSVAKCEMGAMNASKFCTSQEWLYIWSSVHAYTPRSSWNQNFNTMEPYWSQHNSLTTWDVAQEYSSVTFISFCFHSSEKNL